MTRTYDVHWNKDGRFASLEVTVSGADKAELTHNLWEAIRDKIKDANLVTGVWEIC